MNLQQMWCVEVVCLVLWLQLAARLDLHGSEPIVITCAFADRSIHQNEFLLNVENGVRKIEDIENQKFWSDSGCKMGRESVADERDTDQSEQESADSRTMPQRRTDAEAEAG